MAGNEVRLVPLNEEGKENLEVVEKLLKEKEVNCCWVVRGDVLNQVKSDDVIYVVDPAHGDEVGHLVDNGLTVIGAQCAVTVLKHNIQLNNNLKYPVYNLTMMGMLVSLSNFQPSDRSHLISLVERMGGRVSGELTGNVSHLVVKEVGSVKYFSACHAKIPVMRAEWLEYLWKQGTSRYISAKDGAWDEFKCPIFLGCSVCVTGFGSSERNRIQKLVSKFGGEYCGAMKSGVTTHLVVYKPEGQKYSMAKKFGVKVVDVGWVYNSVDKGWCQDHIKYPVIDKQSDKQNSSTPEKGFSKIPALQDMSCISVTNVNETVNSTIADSSRLSTINTQRPVKHGELFNFDLNMTFDPVLDAFTLFCVGFSVKEEEQLKKIVNLSGASWYNTFTSGVTHVIVGGLGGGSGGLGGLSGEVRAAVEAGKVHAVCCSWILESLKQSSVAVETEHWATEVPPPSVTMVTMMSSTHTKSSTTKSLKREGTNFNEMLSQYFEDEAAESTMTEQNLEDISKPLMPKKESLLRDNTTRDSAMWAIFQEKTFVLFGFNDEEKEKCSENIRSFGGNVISMKNKCVADYAVVPTTGWQVERTVQNIVTDYWVEECINMGELLGLGNHPMFTPFHVPNHARPLGECVVCISQYTDPLRSYLVELIEELGGCYQDNVVKKDIASESLLRTTHLIVMSCNGDKYNGCRKWGIPVVSEGWLYACANLGGKVSEVDYPPGGDKEQPLLQTNEAEKLTKIDFPPRPQRSSAVERIRQRVEMKQRKEKLVETPLREKILRLNLATPSKFMTKGVDPNVSFDLDEVFEYLRTPDQTRMEMKQAMRDKPDTPLSVFVERFLAESLKGIDDSSNIVANLEKVFDKEEVNYDITGGEESIKSKEILRGVVVYVSKKLSDQRLKLNELVKQLGGEVRLGYDGSCTHFVFQGKNNDPNREFRLARSDGKFIVSPHWVAACEDGRVGEGEFPHDYDPNRSIQIVRKPSLSSNIEKPEGDNVDSQEVRESLRRTLENIMSGKPSVARTQRLSCNTVFTPEATRDKRSDEMSQDVQVVWDDPIGREEMERLQCLQTMVNPPKEEAQNINEGKPPMFLISSVAPDKKVEYAAIIQDLGGKYLDRDYFDPECTHLIVQKPARNEKYLASLSAGKWVLHTSYIEACKKANTFVKEEEYEYGNPSFEWSPSNEIESLLGASAIRWRQLLGSSGAFSGWKVILHLNDRQSPGFVRLLQSGSASVVATSLPYSGPLEGITHAILDQNKIKQIPSTDVENLVRAGVHCCLPEYIAEYLMKDPQPKPEDLYLPLVKTMLFESGNTDSGTPKKRRRFN